MAFLGALMKKSQPDPMQALREKADANPNDPRAAHDLAVQLKSKGQNGPAVDYARKAARAHQTQGFAQRALAELKSALTWGTPSAELLREVAALHLELQHKEDARSTLLQLRRVLQSSGQNAELAELDAQLATLGPGR